MDAPMLADQQSLTFCAVTGIDQKDPLEPMDNKSRL